MADSNSPTTSIQNPEESNSETTNINSQQDSQNLQSIPNPVPESNSTQLSPNCTEETLQHLNVRALQTKTDLHPPNNKNGLENADADAEEPESHDLDIEHKERENVNLRISSIPATETHKDFSSNLEEASQVHVESNTDPAEELEEKKGLQHEDYILDKLGSIIVNSKTSLNFIPFPSSTNSSDKPQSHYNTKTASFSQSETFEQNHHQIHMMTLQGENYNEVKLKQEESHLFHRTNRNIKTLENFNGVDFVSGGVESTNSKKDKVYKSNNSRAESIKSVQKRPNSFYSAQNLDKESINPSQNSTTFSNSTTRIRLGNELELKKFYDIGRNKYDEILQMHRATNAIIAIFATSQKQLKIVQEFLQKVVCTADLDTPITIFDAWIGTIAEVLKLLNQESIEVKNSTIVGKQRHLQNAKKAVEVNMKESTSRINLMENILEKLNKVIKSCENSVSSICIGCRSRFFQSVWQTDMLYKSEKNNMNDPSGENKKSKGQKGGQLQVREGLRVRIDSQVNDMFCVSSSMSNSSLLSLHLLTPYIRWDVDGISMRKNIARSWPFIKFSSLNFPKKTTMISEFFTGFTNFLQAPINSMTNALETLEESSNIDSYSISSSNRPVKYYNKQNQNQKKNQRQNQLPPPQQNFREHSKSKGNSEIISMLDYQFQIILTCLLSERYFHPREQHIALVCSLKIKESFRILEEQLEMVRVCCRNIRETWRVVFKNGDVNLSTANIPVESTNVYLWKSAKRFSFQLDLEQSIGVNRDKLISLRKSDIISTNSNVKLPKLINKNIRSAIEDHFETLEDYEESYETRLFELVHRKELFIVENDIRQCADLPQQFFYYFEHIGTTLNKFTQSIISKTKLLLDPIPTDPPTSPTNYSDYNPLRVRWGFRVEEPFFVVALMGWESAILEMLNVTRRRFFKLKDTPILQRKLVQISKSLEELKEVLRNCIQTSKKAEKSMNRLLKHIEGYFDPLNDPMNTSSQAASTENLPLLLNNSSGPETKKAARENSPPVKKEKIQDPIKHYSMIPEKNTITKTPEEGEVSILVTNNGVYFNQFGVLFASRLDTTTAEHQLRIIELFANHAQSQIDDSIKLVTKILEKFGKETFPSDSWWRFGFGMKSFIPPNSSESLLIDGTLQEEIYSKSIFHLMRNLEAAFKNDNVKAHLSIYSQLEALVLIRTSRILEEEILLFEKSCASMRQGLKNLVKFQKYFKRAHNKLFNSSSNGSMAPFLSSRKSSSPFEKWNQKISCFKLIIHDDRFKTELDRILTSTASENLSRSSSTNIIKSNKSKSKTPKSTKISIKRSKTMSQRKMKQIMKNHEIPAIIIIRDIRSRWNENVHYALKLLREENAYTPESRTKLNNVQVNNEPSKELQNSVGYQNNPTSEDNAKFQNPNGKNNIHDNNYLSYIEGSAICTACAVTQLKLETFPPRFKYQLMKKIKNLCSRISECRAIVSHGMFVCNEKLDKITSRVDETLQIYGQIHQRQFENDVDGQSLSTLTSQEIIVNENDPDSASLATFKNMMIRQEAEENEESPTIIQPAAVEYETHVNEEEDEEQQIRLHEQDVFISLNFAFESLILSYRGYERSALFRSWSKKPPEQTKIMECIMNGISERLSDIVDNIRKISFEHIHLNRSVKKLSEKVKESLPLPLEIVTEVIMDLKKLKSDAIDSKIPTGLQNVHDMLSETENHLNLALKFLQKVTELEREEQAIVASKVDKGRESTLTIRNPYERAIRELVKKPLRIVIPHNKLNHFKLW